MSCRGIRQLKKLSLIYCDNQNSNQNFRNYLCSKLFQRFERETPEISFHYYIKPVTNPHLVATYQNGYVKEIDLKKLTPEEIHNKMIYAVSSFGRDDIKQMGRNVFSHRKSIQGQWTQDLWYQGPTQELERRQPLPQKIVDMEQFKVPKPEKVVRKNRFFQSFLSQTPRKGSETTLKATYKKRPFRFTKQ